MSSGYFVWHDLFTTDSEAARDFYSQLLGWTVSPTDMGEAGMFTSIQVGETMIGSVGALTPDRGTHSHWVSHASVEDLNAAIETIRTTGGTIFGEPWEMAGIGTGIFANDAEGAAFAAFQDANADAAPQAPVCPPISGSPVWHELVTGDVEGAIAFYAGIFGWNHVVWDMGGYDYHGLSIGETPVAGAFQKSDPAQPTSWTIYFESPGSLDEAIASIPMLGGTLIGGKVAVAGTGEIQLAQDPTGATFGLLKSEAM